MKKLLIVFFIFFSTVSVFPQSFEGKVVYQNSFKSKMPNMKDEQFNAMMGTRQEYYLKGGDYKSVFNGTYLQSQLYINKENKLYNKMSNSETYFWNDGSTSDDSIISVKLNKVAVDILGYQCDELILTCKSGVQKYYFNSKFGIDPKLYANHKYGNWKEYLELAKALPLKMIIDNQQFVMESVATEIQPMELSQSDFQLSPNALTAKSPY